MVRKLIKRWLLTEEKSKQIQSIITYPVGTRVPPNKEIEEMVRRVLEENRKGMEKIEKLQYY